MSGLGRGVSGVVGMGRNGSRAGTFPDKMAEKVMVEAEDVEMDRGSDDDEDAMEGGE